MPLSLTWAEATTELTTRPTTDHSLFIDTPSLDTVRLPAREVPGAHNATQARDRLGELASRGNDRLLLGNHIEDAVFAVLDVEDEFA